MKHRSYILVLSLLTLATLSIAQDQRETSAKAQERITREVRHELLMLPYFGVFDNIAFKVDGYNVTLLGQVVRPSLKSDAENAVKHIEGVEKIDNQIEVLPPSPTDDSLRLALYRAIYGYPALEKYALGVQKPIRIIVKNGHVTLLGQVVRPSLKSDAENTVKHIEGVERVDNQIKVLPTSPMDDRLRLALYHAIYGDPALERYALGVQKPIRIIVNNGHVTLEGAVDNDGDRNIAGLRANGVPGIFSVTNNLQVVSSK